MVCQPVCTATQSVLGRTHLGRVEVAEHCRLMACVMGLPAGQHNLQSHLLLPAGLLV